MTIGQFWTIIIKQWKLIVVCFFVVGTGAFVGSKLMKPLYQSATLVQVVIRDSNNQVNYDNLLASEQLVQTDATLATSDPVLREVASHYPGLTVLQLAQEVTASPKSNTQLFEIDVVDTSPTRAAALANDVAATLIKQRLQALQQYNDQAQQQIQQNLTLTSRQIDTTTTKIAVLQAQGGNEGQVALLQAQLRGLQQTYSQWQTSLAQLELAQAQSGNPLQVAQSAQPASNPVRPNLLLNTGGGLLVGLLLGMLLAILFEQMDTRIRTSESLTQLLDWPVLATIWRVRLAKQEKAFSLTGRDGNVEGYRMLRTNIAFSGVDRPLHSLMITSAMPRDGKSTIAANLAIAMARAEKTTLLVDADLRRPAIHELFDLPANTMGFSSAILACSMPKLEELNTDTVPGQQLQAITSQPTNALAVTNISLEPFVHTVGVPNLWVMPSGPLPPNPPELLESKAMRRLLAVMRNYGIDIVIFDTPPVFGLSDVGILASKVDGTLVVVDTTSANKKSLNQTKAALKQTGARVLGCVVNKQRRNRHDVASSYYYQAAEQNDGEDHTQKNVSAVPIQGVSQQEKRNGAEEHNPQNVSYPETITNEDGQATLKIETRPRKAQTALESDQARSHERK